MNLDIYKNLWYNILEVNICNRSRIIIKYESG